MVVLVVCLYCDEPLDHDDDLWCPDCEDGDDAPEAFASRTEAPPLREAA